MNSSPCFLMFVLICVSAACLDDRRCIANDLPGSKPTTVDESWTGWLGPQRNGWVKDFEPPSPWPATLKKVWQIEVGSGYGSPLVSDGVIYQHARQGEDEVIWAVDLESGERKWRQDWPIPFKVRGGGENKGPKSSPILSGGRIFAMSINGVLTAVDASSGELLWQKDYSDRYQNTHPHWGASTSPIVDGNKVIAHFGNDNEGVLAALDTETGNVVWENANDGASYSSPLIVEIEGNRQLIEWNHRALTGIELASGKALWDFPFPHVGNNQNMPTPAVYENIVLVGGENRGVKGIRINRIENQWSAEELWFQKDVALDMSTAVVSQQMLVGMSHYRRGRLFALDIESGKVHWQTEGRVGENVTFLAFPNHVLALINNGNLKVLKVSPKEFNLEANYKVADSETWAPPVLLKDGLLIKDENSLTYWSLQE